MKRSTAISLYAHAEEVAQIYSDPNRKKNHREEVFDLVACTPTSDNVAGIILRHTPRDNVTKPKLALSVCILVNGKWFDFFPSTDHILGLEGIRGIYQEVERRNFSQNLE